MSLNDKYQVTLIFSSTDASGDLVNVLHYESTVVSTSLGEFAYCAEIGNLVKAAAEADLVPDLSDNVTLVEIQVFNQTQPQYSALITVGTSGQSADDALSPRTAAVCTKRTGFRGRSYRGRMYVTGLVEAYQSGGSLTAAYIDALQDYLDDLVTFTAGTGNQYHLQVYSPTLNIWSPVVTFSVNSVTGTIRGRKKA